MSTVTLFLLAVGLAMDAFAVSVCKGLAMNKITFKKSLIVGLWFGIFQAGMPVIGYLLGAGFQDKITAFDHWIAFILLALIGANMIREAIRGGDDDTDDSLAFGKMLVLAVATSIDALAVGITFAFLTVNIVKAAAFIGIITLLISMAGVKIGNIFGDKYQAKAQLIGGLILILLGTKILIEHLGA